MKVELQEKRPKYINIGDIVVKSGDVYIVARNCISDRHDEMLESSEYELPQYPYLLVNLQTGFVEDAYKKLRYITNDVDRKIENVKLTEI